jgi:hypothetical protein
MRRFGIVSIVGTNDRWSDAMAKPKKKPKGMGKFKSLLRKLVKVPKEEVDKLVSQSKRKRRKK